VARMIRSWFPSLGTMFQQHQQVADQYGIRLLFYEGGGEIRPRTPSNPSTQAIYAFQRDTAAYNVSREWFRRIRTVTNPGPFVYFHLASRADDVNEGYGALLNLFETTSPKYQALLDEMGYVPMRVRRPSALPAGVTLSQNYPNPFNPTTTIRYRIVEAGRVSLFVYDLLGREVSRLVDGWMPAGEHQALFSAGGLSSGPYVYRLRSGGEVTSAIMHLLK
jgi:hypothetical protein